MKLREEAASVYKRLAQRQRSTKDPLDFEAGKLIVKLIEELDRKCRPTKERGKIHPLHQKIILLFQNRITKDTRDAAEITAFKKIKSDITEEDLANLKRFYARKRPSEFDQYLSARKTTPLIFMRDYYHQAELAREWCEKNAAQTPTAYVPEIAEPEGWQEHAPGALGERSWEHVVKNYPDIAKQITQNLKS